MPDYKEKPTAEFISALAKHLADVWRPVHAKFERVDKFYWGTYSLWPEGMQRPEYHPPRAAAIVDHAADALMTYSPIVKKVPAGLGEEHKRRADTCEPAVAAILRAAALQEPSLTWYMAGKYLVAYGYEVIEGPLLDLTDKPKEPKRKEGEGDEEFEQRQAIYQNQRITWFPIRIRAPHPASVLMDPLEKQPTCALRLGVRYAQELQDLTRGKAAYGKQAQVYQTNGNLYQPIRVMEFWSSYWHAMMDLGAADSQSTAYPADVGTVGSLLFVERNPFGFVPFTHAFAGFGLELTNPGRFDPSPLAVSLLEPVMEGLKQDAQRQASSHNVLIEAAWPRVGTTKEPLEAADELSDEQAVLKGTPADFWYLRFPELPASLDKMGMELDRDIQEGTYMRDVAGARQAGVSTVGQQQMLKLAADRKFEKLRLQLNHQATIVTRNILRLVDTLGEELSVQDGGKLLRLRPEDIEHSYAVEVEFKNADPFLQMQQRAQGAQEVAAGLKSAETWRESDAGIENEAEEQRRLLYEAARKMPAVAQELALAALREAGLGDLADRMAKVVASTATGTAPQPQQAPQGGVP